MPDFSSWWGGQGMVGPQGLLTPQSLPQALNQAPVTPGPQPIQTTTPLSPGQAASAGGLGAAGPGFTQGDLWSRVMNALGGPGAGGFKMPGTTVGAPAGAPGGAGPMMPQAPVIPGGAAPPGIPYFRNQTFGQNTNSGLLQQYLALQQMMRGA